MLDIVVAVLVALANILGAGMILPQVMRLKRRSSDGVSGVWAGVGIAMNTWWLAYGVQAPLWGLIPVSSVSGVLYASIGWQLWRQRGHHVLRDLVAGALSIGLVPLPFLVLDGWPAAGTAIGLCYGLQFAPAAMAAFRSDRLTGVSPTTWSMALTEAMIWLVYGFWIDDRALVIGGIGSGLMAAVILGRLAAVHLRLSVPAVRAGTTGGNGLS